VTIRRNRSVAVAAGVGAVVSSVGTTMLGFAAPALAVTAPACDATKTDAAVRASLNTTNAAALKAYLKSKPYLALHTNTLKTKAAWVKAKGKAKVAALKKYKAAQVKEAAAIAAFKKANNYSTFSGTATPARIATTVPDTHPGLWDWGTYTTRVLVKGGVVVNVCTNVDQTNDGNDANPPVMATAQDKLDSQNLYQGIDKPFATNDIPGNLPVMWYATLVKPAKTQAAIEANVNTCIHAGYTVLSAACPKGGLNNDVTNLTGATYTVQGYTTTLHAALTAAKAAKSIG
jgi:hypothetical protein